MTTISGYRFITWVMRLVLLGFVAERLWAGDKVAAGTLTVFLALSFAYLLRSDRLPTVFDALVGASALLNGFGFVFNLYREIPYYDNVAHAITIFSVTLAFFYLVYRDSFEHDRPFVMAVSVFTFGVSVGALWEIVEWSAEAILNTNVVFGLDDTVTDLMTNTLGALAAAVLALAIRDRYPAPPNRETANTPLPNVPAGLTAPRSRRSAP